VSREAIKKKLKEIEIFRYPNVVGYSERIHKRIRKGQIVDEDVIRIYVENKVEETALKPSEVIPKSITIDGKEYKTDVVKIGKVKKLDSLDPKQKWRPAPAGVSTGRADMLNAGTVGWYVVDEDGNIYAISNNHVWANENKGVRSDPLVQPSRIDGGDPVNDTLYLLYDFVPISFTSNNTVDVAIATITSLRNVYMSILNVGGIAGKRIPEVNELASKMGRTTGLTTGTVIDTNATLQVGYDSGTATFEDTIVINGNNIVQAGDSGSPVFTSQNEFIGLLFAGSDDGSNLIACKYTNIERELSTRLNKKVNVLIANSSPPFFRPITIANTQTAINEALQFAMMIAIIVLVFTSVKGVEFQATTKK